jgi:hypothetical protein
MHRGPKGGMRNIARAPHVCAPEQVENIRRAVDTWAVGGFGLSGLNHQERANTAMDATESVTHARDGKEMNSNSN